jgi:tRNA (mo5U34)-methyltransferase
LSFIEHHYAGDPTNWWVPNRACTAAMLRSAGFRIDANPEEEVFVCRAAQTSADAGAVEDDKGHGAA